MISPLLRQFPPSKLGKLIEPEFIFGAHLQAVEHHILDMFEDKFDCLSIQLPIRHSKSTYAAIVCLWLLCINPEERILIAAFSSTASEDILRKVKNALLAWGPKINRIEVDPKNNRADYFKLLRHTGECRAVSIGSRFSQASATTIIIDDVYTEESAASETQRQSVEDWFFATLMNRRTRSKRGNAKVISTMTPRHPEDILAKLQTLSKGLPARLSWMFHRQSCIENGQPIFPEMWPLASLQEKKKELEDAGKSHVWQTLWQCNPTTKDFYAFDPVWFNDVLYDFPKETLPDAKIKVITTDPSFGAGTENSDYFASLYLHIAYDGTIYVDDLYLAVGKPDTLIPMTVGLFSRHQDIQFAPFESNAGGIYAAELVKKGLQEQGLHFPVLFKTYTSKSEDEKISRITLNLFEILQNRKLKIRNTPMGRVLLSQLQHFPDGKKDGADALATGVIVIKEVQGGCGTRFSDARPIPESIIA